MPAARGPLHGALADIRRSTVNLAIWRRASGDVVVAASHPGQFEKVVEAFAIATLPVSLAQRLLDAGYAEPDARVLAADISELAATFATIMDTDRVAIRLEVIETDACRRFHADYVTARLICTYAGPGTQWLDDADAAALAAGAEPGTLKVRQLRTGDVAIFKGWLWAPDAPAIHRSPPIAGSGVRRIVLIIDPAPAAPIAHA